MSPGPTLDDRHVAFCAARRAMLMAFRDWLLAGALRPDVLSENARTAELLHWIESLGGMP